MNKTIKCKPSMDGTYANCDINGKEVKCMKRNNERGVVCKNPTDYQGNMMCNSIDFFCHLPSGTTTVSSEYGMIPNIYPLEEPVSLFGLKRSEMRTDVNTVDIVKINNMDFFYYFSYGEQHLFMLKKLYENYYNQSIPMNEWNVMVSKSHAGNLKKYSRNFFTKSQIMLSNGSTIRSSLATLYPNENRSVNGIIIPLPIKMLEVLDKSKNVAEKMYRRIKVKAKIIIGPLEENKGDDIMCTTYIGAIEPNNNKWYVDTPLIKPEISYLAEIATMIRDRRNMIDKDLHKMVYRIDIFRNDEQSEVSCVKLRYTYDNNGWIEEKC